MFVASPKRLADISPEQEADDILMMPALEKKDNLKILVVDDDPNEMRSLVIGLRLEGFDAIGASSGPTALNMLDQESFRVVIIDLMMPEMNGLQLARAVRDSYPSITTLLMSAYHLSPVQLARADTGVAGFVPKPFCFEELVRFIQSKVDPDALSEPAPVKIASELHTPIDISSTHGGQESSIPLIEQLDLLDKPELG